MDELPRLGGCQHPAAGTRGLAPLSQGEVEMNTSTWWGQVQVCLNETPGTSSLKNNWDSVTAFKDAKEEGPRGNVPGEGSACRRL